MKFSNTNLIAEEVKLDERQKAIIGEISTECIRLWYVLNMMATLFGAAFWLADLLPAGKVCVIAVFIVYYAITFLCLSVFDIRTAAKGVMTQFMGVKMNSRGIIWTIVMNAVCIFIIVSEYLAGSNFFDFLDAAGIVYFALMFVIGIVYDVIHLYCCKKNKAVIDEMLKEE